MPSLGSLVTLDSFWCYLFGFQSSMTIWGWDSCELVTMIYTTTTIKPSSPNQVGIVVSL
jgi:hypothetical protein